jgi:hypothetical protein
MSLAIVWRPSKEVDTRLDVPAPSDFLDMMSRAGYSVPCSLDDDDLPVMRAMAVVFSRVGGGDEQRPNPFQQIADLIMAHDSIDLNTSA